MAAKIIKSSDTITVSRLTTVIFGAPGTGKTSLCQTAEAPITLDFDEGIHRSFNRKAAIRLDTWLDIEAADAEYKKPEYKTVIVDTAGRMLDLLVLQLITESTKNGNKMGGLSIAGYGVLATRFALWANALKAMGKDIIMIAHEKEEKDGDDRIFRPEMIGKSYGELCKQADLIGYLWVDRNGKRTLNFKPSDRAIGKDSAGIGLVEVGDLGATSPHFMSRLLADAKAKITGYSKAQADAVAKQQGASSPPPPVAPPPPAVPPVVPPAPVAPAEAADDGPPDPASPPPPPAEKTSAEKADEMIVNWQAWVKTPGITPEQFQQGYIMEHPNLKPLAKPDKDRVWAVIKACADAVGVMWSTQSASFVKKG